MNQKVLDLVYICDENYLLSTLISIRSLKANRGTGWKYRVTVVSDELSAQSVKALQSEQEGVWFVISIYESTEKFEEIKTGYHYVSRSALLKFKLSSMLAGLDKVLYVDGDILFRRGFEQITKIQPDAYYAAVVKDMPTYSSSHRQELGLEEYFNSGVMYLNLKKMRDDRIEPRLLEYKKTESKHLFMDQDAFNVVFHEKVLFLHPGYNCICEAVRSYTSDQIAMFYDISLQEAVHLTDSACMLHMAGKKKPWNDPESEQMEEWISYIHDFREFAVWERGLLLQLREEVRSGNQALEQLRIESSSRSQELQQLRERNKQLETQITQDMRKTERLKEQTDGLEMQNQHLNRQIALETEQFSQTICRIENGYAKESLKLRQMVTALERRLTAMENWVVLRIYRSVKKRLSRRKQEKT